MNGIIPHEFVEGARVGCGSCGYGPGAAHHNSHEVRRYMERTIMKTIQIPITSARTLEHAMDLAIESAGYSCDSTTTGTSHRLYKVNKVTFKTFVAEIMSPRDTSFTYHFEAELEEL